MKLRNYLIYLISPIVLLGCVHSPENEYYLIQSSLTQNPATWANNANKNLLIRNVNVADYLDRLNLVTFQEDGKLKIDDFHQWAEPLNSNIRSVLAQDLAHYLASTQVYDQKMNAVSHPDFILDVSFSKLDNKNNKSLHCKAEWMLTLANNKDSKVGNFDVSLPMVNGNHKVATETISHCLDLIAKDMANQLTRGSYLSN